MDETIDHEETGTQLMALTIVDKTKSPADNLGNTPEINPTSPIGKERQSTRRRLEQDYGLPTTSDMRRTDRETSQYDVISNIPRGERHEECKSMDPTTASKECCSTNEGGAPLEESILQQKTRVRLTTTATTRWITINAVPLNTQHISEVVAVARRDGYNILPGIEDTILDLDENERHKEIMDHLYVDYLETRVPHMMAKIRFGVWAPPKSGTLMFINQLKDAILAARDHQINIHLCVSVHRWNVRDLASPTPPILMRMEIPPAYQFAIIIGFPKTQWHKIHFLIAEYHRITDHRRIITIFPISPIIEQSGHTHVWHLAIAIDGDQRITDNETRIMQYTIREWAGVGNVSVHPTGLRDTRVQVVEEVPKVSATQPDARRTGAP